jgi:hypothetical protein
MECAAGQRNADAAVLLAHAELRAGVREPAPMSAVRKMLPMLRWGCCVVPRAGADMEATDDHAATTAVLILRQRLALHVLKLCGRYWRLSTNSEAY